jgi:hypothetical protein
MHVFGRSALSPLIMHIYIWRLGPTRRSHRSDAPRVRPGRVAYVFRACCPGPE